MENFRLGNIELRMSKSLFDKKYWEIVCYYPNHLYKKESDFEWCERKQMYQNKETPNYYASKECFVNPESCYTLAFFNFDKEYNEPNLESCGSRPFRLNDDDYDNYHKITKYVYDNWEKMYEDQVEK